MTSEELKLRKPASGETWTRPELGTLHRHIGRPLLATRALRAAGFKRTEAAVRSAMVGVKGKG